MSIRAVALASLIAVLCGRASAVRPLISLDQIRRLTPAEAEKEYRVRLRAVVTFYDRSNGSVFLSDGTRTVLAIPGQASSASIQPGQEYLIGGRTNAGRFAPVIAVDRWQRLGNGPMPAALHPTFDQLASGKLDSQWVEVRGIVHSAVSYNGQIFLRIADGRNRFQARVPGMDFEEANRLVNAGVRIRGNCSNRSNDRREIEDIIILVPNSSDILVEQMPPADPFRQPPTPLQQLLLFRAQNEIGHLIKVRGTITYSRGAKWVFLAAKGRGLRIVADDFARLHPGDTVEAVGFLELDGDRGAPILEDAQVRILGKQPDPAPVPVTFPDASGEEHEAQLVTTDGTLFARTDDGGKSVLTLRADGVAFTVEVPGLGLRPLIRGSRLGVTGILLRENTAEPGEQRAVRLLLRSAGDVRIVSPPPTFTLERSLWILGAVAGVLLISLGWVVVLRRRVRTQTAVIRKSLENVAALAKQYQDLFENANDVVYAHDLAGNFISLNRMGERVLGYSFEEATQMNLLQLVAPEQQAVARLWLEKLAAGEPQPTFELEMISKSGARFMLAINARAVADSGNCVRIEGIARDVTERVRTQLLDGHRRYILELIANHARLDVILECIAAAIELRLPGAATTLLLAEGQHLRVAASRGIPEEFRGSIDGLAVAVGAAGSSQEEGPKRPVTVQSIQTDPLWDGLRERALACGLRRCTSVPVLSASGTVLGAIAVCHRDGESPAAGEVEILEVMSGMVALALDHGRLYEELECQAHHDALTGLPNRLLMGDVLEQALAQARRNGSRIAVLYLDLDGFKEVNDRFGHAVGDLLLEEAGKLLRACLRESDTLARLGGDEFLALLRDLNDDLQATTVAERLLEALRTPSKIGGHELMVSASIGISQYPEDGDDPHTLQKRADQAMYAAKSRGKDGYQCFTPALIPEAAEAAVG
jgi:diguanylate cyclase (GGDEF)-like protein/PAS domain S-box-containing protein